MPVIVLITEIKAPMQKVFDLARSVDLHQQSMQHTNEKAIAGKISGLIEQGETVTWQAQHLFKVRQLTSKITSMDAPYYFRDIMIEGDFKLMEHDHYFKTIAGGTEMKDVFKFKSPYGLLGSLVDWLFLKSYLKNLLIKRNNTLKRIAEASF